MWRTIFIPNCACIGVYISVKKLLWVDFTSLALYKTIAIHFLEKVILGKSSTYTIKWLYNYIIKNTNQHCGVLGSSQIIHAQDLSNIVLFVDYTSIALYKIISIHFLQQAILVETRCWLTNLYVLYLKRRYLLVLLITG